MAHKNDWNDSTADVTEQATYWCLWLKDQRRLSFEEALRFAAWLTRSRRHVDEFLRMRRIIDLVTRLKPVHRDQSNVTHVNWWRGSPLQPIEMPEHIEMPKRRLLRGWKVAAIVFALLPGIYFLTRIIEEVPDRTVTTVANASKTRQLEDGSIVSLGADSQLRVEFTELRRNVHFFQGRATFEVVMDLKRPFVVNAPIVDIAAVESKFSVTIDTSVEVEVYEGMVAISERGVKAGTGAVITVRKGQRYRVAEGGFTAMVADGKEVVRSALIVG